MVSFCCDSCNDVIKKNKVEKHYSTSCRSAWVFRCIECGEKCEGYEYKNHNECMTEVQKYQGAFKEKLKQQKEEKEEKTAIVQSELVAPKDGDKPAETKNETSKPEDSLEWPGWRRAIRQELKPHSNGLKLK